MKVKAEEKTQRVLVVGTKLEENQGNGDIFLNAHFPMEAGQRLV